jgi:hypothetical protein
MICANSTPHQEMPGKFAGLETDSPRAHTGAACDDETF